MEIGNRNGHTEDGHTKNVHIAFLFVEEGSMAVYEYARMEELVRQ